MDITEELSQLGSPNIFLRKNFDRGHIYKGVYLIRDSLKANFEAYLPVNHLKARDKLNKQIVRGLKKLVELNNSDYELAQEFVSWLWEHGYIDNCQNALPLIKILESGSAYGKNYEAEVVFISLENMILFKKLLKGYLEFYRWSMLDYKGNYTNEPYYSFSTFNAMKMFIQNIDTWLSIEANQSQHNI